MRDIESKRRRERGSKRRERERGIAREGEIEQEKREGERECAYYIFLISLKLSLVWYKTICCVFSRQIRKYFKLLLIMKHKNKNY